MAVKNVILGTNVDVFVGGVLVGCSTDVSVTGTRQEITANCAGSGDVEQAEVSKIKYTFDMSGLWRQTSGADVATNMTVYEFWESLINKTEVTVVLKSQNLVSEDTIYTGVGYFTSVKMSGVVDSVEKFSVNGFFNAFTPSKQA